MRNLSLICQVAQNSQGNWSKLIRKICIFTGSRADYGHLRWIMQEVQDDNQLILHNLVSGAHLLSRLGETWREIDNDGFTIDTRVELDLENNSNLGTAISVGHGISSFSKSLKKISPDMLVLLGDRYETFAVAVSGMLLQIPIAHIHGGETTEGVIDEAIRHSITKMAHIHFVAASEYRSRIMQLGEAPNRIYDYGAPGLDGLHRLRSVTKGELTSFLGIELKNKIFLVTYHPSTLDSVASEKNLVELLKTLNLYPKATIILTKANSDFGGDKINSYLEKFVKIDPKSRVLSNSLGLERYYSLMKLANVVIGNSSSGIIEAPVIGTPTVNIGTRQKGRARSPSIIDCPGSGHDIECAINTALSLTFQKKAARRISPYGRGDTSKKIVKTLKSISLNKILIKSFNNITF